MNPMVARQLALGLSAFFFLLLYPYLNAFAWQHLPVSARSSGGDFSQYYSAALSVRAGLRETLYPTPHPEIYSKPPTFRPQIPTALFNPEEDALRNGRWAFYPQVAHPDMSELSGKLTSEHPYLADHYHFISPPPLALLLTPLAWVDYNSACRIVWFPLMCASMFGISFFAVKICRHLYQRETYVEAVVAALPLIPALLGSAQATTLAGGNVSPLLGFLTTLAGYAFLTNRQVLLGLCIIPLVLFKGIGLAWCPLLLIGGIKWRAILVMASLTLVLNSATLYLGGVGLYETFFKEILPKANVPLGTGLSGMLMALFGLDAGLWIFIAYAGLLLTLYLFHYKALRGSHDFGSVSLTVVITSMALFTLFNTVVWPNYLSLYLLLPFAPWIIREISGKTGAMRLLMGFLVSSIILCWMDTLFVSRESFLVERLKNANLYAPHLELLRKALSVLTFYGIPNMISVVLLALGFSRLFSWSTAEKVVPLCSPPLQRPLF